MSVKKLKKPATTCEFKAMDTEAAQEIMDRINKLEPEQRELLFETLEISRIHNNGQIPSPTMLERYESVCPGASDKIITIAEKQANHIQEIEKKKSCPNTLQSKLGLVLSFIITIVIAIGGIALIILGKDTAGLVAVIIPILSFAGIFLYGIRSEMNTLRIEKESEFKKRKPKD